MKGDTELNPYAAPAPHADASAAEDAPTVVRTASRSKRLAAALLDGAIGAAPAFGVAALGGNATFGDELSLIVALLPMALIQAWQWYLVATTGQSLAKRWLALRIIRMTGEAPGFLHGVALRSWLMGLLFLIPGVGAVLAVANALFAFRRDARCLHDHLAGTLVIRA